MVGVWWHVGAEDIVDGCKEVVRHLLTFCVTPSKYQYEFIKLHVYTVEVLGSLFWGKGFPCCVLGGRRGTGVILRPCVICCLEGVGHGGMSLYDGKVFHVCGCCLNIDPDQCHGH